MRPGRSAIGSLASATTGISVTPIRKQAVRAAIAIANPPKIMATARIPNPSATLSAGIIISRNYIPEHL